MDLFETLVETLKKNPKKIVFTEGTDARILSATDKLVKSGDFLKPVLVGKVEDVKAAVKQWKDQVRLPAIRDSIKRTKALDYLAENAKVTVKDEVAERAEAQKAESAE